jgi:hypothetical protein
VQASACTSIEAPSPADAAAAPPTSTFDHSLFDGILQRHVDEHGRVDYSALQSDRADLDAYYGALARVSPDSHPQLFNDDDARLAYWINAYNASAMIAVLNDYPIESVKDVNPAALFFVPRVTGFFLLRRVTLGAKQTNLYDLENGIIRKRFAEPRIHFALNCASASCPRLPRRAFTADGLQAELERETRLFVSEPRNFGVDPDDQEIVLSAIFDWYEEDFVQWMKAEHPAAEPTLASYVRLQGPPERVHALDACQGCRIVFADHDWTLNDQRLAD